MESNANIIGDLVEKLELKKYQPVNNGNFIQIQINNRKYRISFYRLYKDKNDEIKKEENKIQFWVEDEAAIKNYLTTYKGVNEKKMLDNMYKEIFYYNPLNSGMDSVLKSFEKFVEASSDTRLCNHHKYVKNLVNICKKILQEEQLSDDLKEKINAVLCVTKLDLQTDYGGCKQTRELMKTIREQMIKRGFIDSGWPGKVDELCKQKKSGEVIRECRSCKITNEFIKSFVKNEKANGYRERDKGWNYYDDGMEESESDNKYYYANALDHYITHLVYGIVKTQTGDMERICFCEKGGLEEMHAYLKDTGICEK